MLFQLLDMPVIVPYMIKAIIFDFDGVIVLSEHSRFRILQSIAGQHGLKIKDNLLKSIVGRTTVDFFRLNFPNLGDGILEKILHEYQVEYKDKVVDHVTPISFTNEFIRHYKGDRVLAVASNADTKVLDTLLKHLGLHSNFKLIVGKEHASKHKPDPEIYTYTAKELGLTSQECVVLEDTAVGAQAANNAGMKVFAILNGINTKEDFASVTVEKFLGDLPEIRRALGASGR